MPKWEPEKIRLGVSACLLGDEVRYDGGHKRDAFLVDTLGPFVEWVPVCPEVEVGLGVPCPAIRLVGSASTPSLVVERTGEDITVRMQRWAKRRVAELQELGLHGYVLKRGASSCGLFRVRVHGGDGRPRQVGRGLFAAALTDALPTLPVEEEGRLADAGICENFIERVFPSARWQAFSGARPRACDLIAHLAGFFKRQLTSDERAELSEAITEYGRGLVPLVVPITMLKHHVRRLNVAYLAEQVYLAPHPRELMLRNHV
jgi:uncharacterized protein YbbK (DUF523 family)